MTLEYRCSKCGTLLDTSNADELINHYLVVPYPRKRRIMDILLSIKQWWQK